MKEVQNQKSFCSESSGFSPEDPFLDFVALESKNLETLFNPRTLLLLQIKCFLRECERACIVWRSHRDAESTVPSDRDTPTDHKTWMADIFEPSFLNAGPLLGKDLKGCHGQHLRRMQALCAQGQRCCLHICSSPCMSYSSQVSVSKGVEHLGRAGCGWERWQAEQRLSRTKKGKRQEKAGRNKGLKQQK